MSQENEIKLSIAVETQEGSIQRAKRALDGVQNSVQDVARELSRMDDRADFDETIRKARELEQAVENVGDAARQTGQQLQSSLDAANDRFSRVSNDVALAGDAESALRTVGGAASAFGGQGVGQAIGVGAELFAVTEALPRLKTALAAFPQTAGAAAAALGTTTGRLATLGAATVALGIITQIAINNQQKYTAQAQGLTAALLNQNNLQRQSTEDLTSTLQEYRTQLQDQKEDLQTATSALSNFEAGLNFFERIFSEIGNLFNSTGSQLGILRNEESRLNKTTAELELNIRNAERILQERGVSESELSSTTSKATETTNVAADAQRQFAELMSQSQSTTNTAMETRINSEQRYSQALQQTTVQSAVSARQARNREANAIDRARAQERRQSYRDSLARIREQQLAENEARQEAQDERISAVRDFFQNEQQESIRHWKTLADIRRDAQRSERDALREGDIFGIRDLRERLQEQISDANNDFSFDRNMRAMDFMQQQNITFNITGNDPQAIAAAVQREIQRTFR